MKAVILEIIGYGEIGLLHENRKYFNLHGYNQKKELKKLILPFANYFLKYLLFPNYTVSHRFLKKI